MDVRKSMGSALGAKQAAGNWLHEKSLYAPTRSAVDEIITQFTLEQEKYLD